MLSTKLSARNWDLRSKMTHVTLVPKEPQSTQSLLATPPSLRLQRLPISRSRFLGFSQPRIDSVMLCLNLYSTG